MVLSQQAFSPTHGSTMLHSLLWTIKTNQISSEQNLLGEPQKIFKVEKLNPQQEETIKKPFTLNKKHNKYTCWNYLSNREYNNC